MVSDFVFTFYYKKYCCYLIDFVEHKHKLIMHKFMHDFMPTNEIEEIKFIICKLMSAIFHVNKPCQVDPACLFSFEKKIQFDGFVS